MGTPIINLPQTGSYLRLACDYLLTKTAVLGLHAIKERAVVVNGKVEVRPVCKLPDKRTFDFLLT